MEANGPLHGPWLERYWSADESDRFLEGVAVYGWSNWRMVSRVVGTRSNIQCRSYAQVYVQRLVWVMNEVSIEEEEKAEARTSK